jgi:hypothetical protein
MAAERGGMAALDPKPHGAIRGNFAPLAAREQPPKFFDAIHLRSHINRKSLLAVSGGSNRIVAVHEKPPVSCYRQLSIMPLQVKSLQKKQRFLTRRQQSKQSLKS